MEPEKFWTPSTLFKPVRLISFILSLIFSLSAGFFSEIYAKELRMLISADIHCGCLSGDIYGPLEDKLKDFETRNEVTIRLQKVPQSYLRNQLLGTSHKDAPDVIWIDADSVPIFVSDKIIVPLDKMLNRWEPYSRLPNWNRRLFEFKDNIYGLPLAPEGNLRLNAYAITKAAQTRGLEPLAFKLITYLSPAYVVCPDARLTTT